MDYNRLIYLNQRIKAGNATGDERKEYMLMLYRNGSITKSQYDAFIANNNTEEIFKAAVIIGGALLVGYLLTKLIDGVTGGS